MYFRELKKIWWAGKTESAAACTFQSGKFQADLKVGITVKYVLNAPLLLRACKMKGNSDAFIYSGPKIILTL